MAAILLRLPSIIRSEQYALINPHAHIAYIHHIQKEEQAEQILDKIIAEANDKWDAASAVEEDRDDFIDEDVDEMEQQQARQMLDRIIAGDDPSAAEDDQDNFANQSTDDIERQEDEIPLQTEVQDPKSVLYQLGYIESFPVTDGKKTYRTLFPQCSLYANRGQQLKHLNRLEYRALIKFKAPSQAERKRLEEFPFSKGFHLHGIAVQTIKPKQQTPIVIRKPPRHPGKKPSPDSDSYQNWLQNANHYAEFYLTLFRPEPDCCEKNQINTYEYTWDALELFVEGMQNDDSIISKF